MQLLKDPRGTHWKKGRERRQVIGRKREKEGQREREREREWVEFKSVCEEEEGERDGVRK